MLREIPVFGEKKNHVDYQNRYGVYAIVERKNSDNTSEYCLVQTPNGAFYLPGGEIETNENHAAALSRELLEELGATAEIGAFLGQADEYFYSSHRKKYFYNPAYLYALNSVKFDHAPLEDFNNLIWFTGQEALQNLKRESHKWGLSQYLNLINKK